MTAARLIRSVAATLFLAFAGCETPTLPEAGAAPPDPLAGASMDWAAEASPLAGEGPSVRITVPSQNASIDLAGPGPTVVTVRYEWAPAPGGTTGGLVYLFDAQPETPVPDLSGAFSLTAGVGLHSLTLVVTDDLGAPYEAARATIVFKVTAPCQTADDCVDDNPCSADFCFIVGVERRCQYGVDPAHPLCCLNRFDCAAHEMCVDLFPLGQPDGYRECIECDGSPDNCPPRPCHDATCHPLSYQCTYERRADDCCIPGEDVCARAPCEACLSDDGFEGTCRAAGPPGSCCFQTEGAAGAPTYGCETDDPCAVTVCESGKCRSDTITPGCCTDDDDCDDPRELNVCTGDRGTCVPTGVEGGLGRCTYPRLADCCVIDGECQDRFPVFVGRCDRSVPGAPGTCVYEPNPAYCVWDGPGVVINELHVDSDVGYGGDWFELYNASGNEIDLLGWRLESGESAADALYIVGDAPVLLPPGGHFVVGHTMDPAQNGGVDVDYAGYGLDLPLASGALRLVDRAGQEVDFVFWDASFPMLPGRAMGRTSPFREGDTPAAWRSSERLYGAGGRGSPGRANVDVYDPTWQPTVCDDGDPCTLDLCHGDLANVCAHRAVADCCDTPADPACSDGDVCTIDTCEVASFACRHTFDVGTCCRSDGECPPAPPGLPLQEEVLWSVCTVPVCANQRCLYTRNPLRPGCCVSSTDPQLGCRDGNPCTPNVCQPGAGTTEFGTPYNACVFPLDTDADGLNDCCAQDGDCDDGDILTRERCRTDAQGTQSHTCERGPDTDYCGPEAPSHTCDDGNPCTADTCCDDVDEPLAGCPGAFRCLHEAQLECCAEDAHCRDTNACTLDRCCFGPGDPVAACTGAGACAHIPVAACCEADEDCEAQRPQELACLVSTCIGGRCVYGPGKTDPGCCSADADCDDGDRCTVEACVEGQCTIRERLAPPACCHERRECPVDSDPCFRWECWQQACVRFPVHDCCALADEGVSTVCDDGDPCTDDLCHGGLCWHTPPEEPGCCTETADCPASGSVCASVACAGAAHECRVAAVAGCVAPLPFRESFWLHPTYRDQVSLAVLGWSQTGGGTPWAAAPGPRGIAGRTARFSPTAATAGSDHCLLSPAIRTVGVTEATLQFRSLFDDGTVAQPGVFTRVLAGAGGSPAEWSLVWVPAETDPAAPADGARWSVPLPAAALNSATTRIAFCARLLPGAEVEPPHWNVWDLVVAAGTPPVWLDVPSEPVVAWSGNARWTPLVVADPGPPPDGGGGPTPFVLRAAGAPTFVDELLEGEAVAAGGELGRRVWVSLRPTDLDVVSHAPATLLASDGALEARVTLPVEVRSSFCGGNPDCQDDDPCTIGACGAAQRCQVYQPPECRPSARLTAP